MIARSRAYPSIAAAKTKTMEADTTNKKTSIFFWVKIPAGISLFSVLGFFLVHTGINDPVKTHGSGSCAHHGNNDPEQNTSTIGFMFLSRP